MLREAKFKRVQGTAIHVHNTCNNGFYKLLIDRAAKFLFIITNLMHLLCDYFETLHGGKPVKFSLNSINKVQKGLQDKILPYFC